MRRISSLILVFTLSAVPLSAHAADNPDAPEASAAEPQPKAAKPAKPAPRRKTASKPGAIKVDKLKQEVSGRIKQERGQVEKQPGAKTSGLLRQFEGAVAQVRSRLNGAVRDGVVTQGELKGVRDTYKLMAVKSAKKPTKKK